jgi:hypothetical protein
VDFENKSFEIIDFDQNTVRLGLTPGSRQHGLKTLSLAKRVLEPEISELGGAL